MMAILASELLDLAGVVTWVRDVCGGPHPTKPERVVCPRAEEAVTGGHLLVEYHPGPIDLDALVRKSLAAISRLRVTLVHDVLATSALVMPELTDDVAEAGQSALRPHTVEAGLIQGIFGVPGSQRDDTHYQRPPLPVLVLRPLDPHDVLMFMRKGAFSPERLGGYITAYAHALVSGEVSDRNVRRLVRSAARRYPDVVGEGAAKAGVDLLALQSLPDAR